MALVQQTAYGYLMDELGQLNEPMEVTLKSNANPQEQATLTGANGISNGTVIQELSVKNSVARGSAERARLYKAHITGKEVTFRYRIDNEQYEVTGKIYSCEFSSAVNKPNGFNYDFKGFPKIPQA